MRVYLALLLTFSLFACDSHSPATPSLQQDLLGSWELISAIQIRKDTTFSTMTPGHKMIKIINQTHFAFLQHALDTAVKEAGFVAGGGKYNLQDNQYVEHLEYCSARGYEGNDFTFQVAIKGDTLIQSGEEKLKDLGLGDQNVKLVETYVRIKE